jgi:predicted alpha/beta superfamily hydrolase
MKNLLVIGILILSQNLFAQYPLTKDLTVKFELNSKSNNTNYTLEVSLPETYTPNKKYPVYYILDGFYAASIAHGAHRTLQFENLIEDVIVVTITGPEKTTSEWLINRWPDYTFSRDTLNDMRQSKIFNLPDGSTVSGKGELFLQTLKQQIFPLIENKYSFNGNRGISGHSMSGQMVTYLMFKTPDLFNRFGINSSFQGLWLNNEIRGVEKNYASSNKVYNAKVFFSFGSLEPKEMIEDIRYFDNQLKSHYKNIETNFVLFADETHTTVVSAMISRCMWYLYKKK